ncbi:hypothetical protein BB559_004395 [Furculomyces boomerangus]|uniref:Threonine/serine exporter-like N-terminal domain-containing protein n=1 Tax=Furculomyces boomerangus TaxID=61424 RepID=A0A2T9YEW6_9FUNG|nr:hypothetical protein BB559_004395 [Furculomyces boomerangus]
MGNPKNFKSSKLNPYTKRNKEHENNNEEKRISSTYSLGNIFTSITGKKENIYDNNSEELKTETFGNKVVDFPCLNIETKLGKVPVRNLVSNPNTKVDKIKGRVDSANNRRRLTRPYRPATRTKTKILSYPSVNKRKIYEPRKQSIPNLFGRKPSVTPSSRPASIFSQIKINLNSKNNDSSRLERAGGKEYAAARFRSDSQTKDNEDMNSGMESDLEFAIPLAMQMISQSKFNSPLESRRTSIFDPDNNISLYSLANEFKNDYDNKNSAPGFESISKNNQKYLNNKLHSGLVDSEKSRDNTHRQSTTSSIFDSSEKYKNLQNYTRNQNFLVNLCKSLGDYGSPSYRLELSLGRMAKFLDVDAYFKSFPGFVLIFFKQFKILPSKTEVVSFSRVYNLHKLELIDALFEDIIRGKIGIDQGLIEITIIEGMGPLYPDWLRLLCSSAASICYSVTAYNGGWKDAILSFVLGLVVQLLGIVDKKLDGFRNLYQFASAFLVGFIAASLSKYTCFGAVVLSSLCSLFPGLGLTTGVIELMARDIVTGTVHVFYSLAVIITLSFGILTGSSVFSTIRYGNTDNDSDLNSACIGLPSYYIFIFYPFVILFTLLSMNIPRKRWLVCSVVASSMYTIFWMLSNRLKLGYFSTVISSFLIGTISNLCGRFFEIPPFIPLLPSIVMLVPGSVGVRSISKLFAGQPGSDLIMRMIITCLSIMIGLFTASFVVFPRGKTKSALITF